MTPASWALTRPGNQVPAQPMAAAPDEGRILIAGRPIADLSDNPHPMLIGLQNLQAAKDKATEAASSPAT